MAKKGSSKGAKASGKKKRKYDEDFPSKSDYIIGVKIIASLYFLFSFMFLMTGVFLLSGSEILELAALDAGVDEEIFTPFGVTAVVISALLYLIALNLWKFNDKARIAVGVISALYLIASLFPLRIFGLAMNGFIIWYLFFNEEVRKLFK